MKELNEKDLLIFYDLLLEYQEYLEKELEKLEGVKSK